AHHGASSRRKPRPSCAIWSPTLAAVWRDAARRPGTTPTRPSPWPRELGMRPLQAHYHRGLGMLHAKTGQHEQARAALSMAIDLHRAMDMTFWLPLAEAALAQASRGEEPAGGLP